MYSNNMVTVAENREVQVAFEVVTEALNDY
jgi:hypothetical protein